MADPRELFPEEVWNLILNCVDDPQDMQSCSKTCILFKTRLSPNQTTWAFPLVFPSLLQFLPKSDVLQCRLVSKDWLKGVDKFLQSEVFSATLVNQLRNDNQNLTKYFVTRIQYPQRQPIDQAEADFAQRIEDGLDQLRGILFRPARGRGRLHGHEHVNAGRGPAANVQDPPQSPVLNFVSAFENNSEKNPFPSRAVLLRIQDTPLEGTQTFFNQFGVHVFSLKLIVNMSETSGVNELHRLWTILKCVPNLKHLLIEFSGHFIIPSLELIERFNNFLATNRPPALNQLKWIELDTGTSFIRDVFIKAYSSRSVTIFEKGGSIKPCHLSNGWKHLTLLVNRQSTTIDWKRHMRSFGFVNLPLESINLQYSKCEDFGLIFKCVSKYAKTLCRFTLTFTNLQIQELIEMRNQVDAIYTYFLSQVKCLENFIMTFDCTNSSDRDIEFRQFVDAILDADWIEDYLEMDGIISGFRRFGYACISAGMQKKADSSSKLKPIYFTNGRYFRSLEVIPQKEN